MTPVKSSLYTLPKVKKTFAISILNQNISIRSERDEAYVQGVAEFVKKKIDDVMSQAKSISVMTACVLTLMNVADELFESLESQAEKKKRLGEVQNKIDHMISTLEELKQNK